ncbi:AAA family ATPase [uncultured Desulfovibrio sp.]|uniref:AAA family ATPase n=1 Tax=uncultured Desulfovibrio sp. TaxID=167968 RepID=UPI00261DA3B8|nr:AAA family ATPase [uncultured Desulfovibrio sp.]
MKPISFSPSSPPSSLSKASEDVVRLVVKNFLTLDDVDCSLGKLTIFIGPQAEGKSLLAKLVDFFYESLSRAPYFEDYKSLKESYQKRFLRTFPKRIWEHDDFTISFFISSYSITIEHAKKRLVIQFNQVLEEDIKKIFSSKKELEKNDQPRIFSLITQKIHGVPYPFRIRPTFIPALRQLFSYASFEGFTYNIAYNQEDVDSALIKFASELPFHRQFWERDSEQAREMFNKSVSRILKGKYHQTQKKDFIINRKEKIIPVSLASSGQQEALPLLLYTRMPFTSIFIVEEPEAHLFPSSQKELTGHLCRTLNSTNVSRMVITTHSPYVLSSFNNFIAAHDVLGKDEERIAAMKKIIPRNCWISYDDVQCFFVENGRITSMRNDEYRMIDAERIDACSDSIVAEYSVVMNILHAEE